MEMIRDKCACPVKGGLVRVNIIGPNSHDWNGVLKKIKGIIQPCEYTATLLITPVTV